MSEQNQIILNNSKTQELSKLLEISENARLNHYAAEILNLEFPSEQALILPHLNNSWIALEALKDFLFVDEIPDSASQKFSNISESHYKIKKERLQKRYNQLHNEFKDISDHFSKLIFPRTNCEEKNVSKKLESHLIELGHFCADIKKFIQILHGWKPIYKRFWFKFILLLCILFLLGSIFYKRYKSNQIEFKVVKATQDWKSLNTNRSVDGNKLRVAGKICESGFGTHANSEIVLQINSEKKKLEGFCGIDDEVGQSGSIQCEIKQNQSTLFKSQILKGSNRSESFSVELNASIPVILLINGAGDGITLDHANWCNLVAK